MSRLAGWHTRSVTRRFPCEEQSGRRGQPKAASQKTVTIPRLAEAWLNGRTHNLIVQPAQNIHFYRFLGARRVRISFGFDGSYPVTKTADTSHREVKMKKSGRITKSEVKMAIRLQCSSWYRSRNRGARTGAQLFRIVYRKA